jgi:hypothetical protein
MISGCLPNAFFMSRLERSDKHFGMNNEAVFNSIIPTAESMPAEGIILPA